MPKVGGDTADLKCRHRSARLCRLTCTLHHLRIGAFTSTSFTLNPSFLSSFRENSRATCVSFFRSGIVITRHRSFCVSHHAAGLRVGSASGCPSLRRRLFPPDTSCLTSHRAKPLPEYLATECEGSPLGKMAHVLDRSGNRLLRSSQCGRTKDGVPTAWETARLAT